MFNFHPFNATVALEPITRITPFTERAGSTYLKILESLAQFVRELAEHVNERDKLILDEVAALVAGLTDTVNNAIADSQALTDQKIAALETTVTDTMAEAVAEVGRLVEQIINSSVTLQDSVVAGILDTESSATRAKLNELYYLKTQVDAIADAINASITQQSVRVTTIEGELATRLSNESLDTRYLKADPFTNVADFGAVGDGVANDAPALQLALNERGLVKLEAGKAYRIGAALTIPSDTTLDLNGSSIVKAYNGSPGGRGMFAVSGTNNVTITNGTLNNNGALFPGVPEGANIVTGLGVKNIKFIDVTFLDVVATHAIDLARIDGLLVEGCSFRGYRNSSDGTRSFSEAIQIDPDMLDNAGSPSKNIVVRDCYFGNSGTPGFSAWPAGVGNHATTASATVDGVTVEGCTFDGCTLAGVTVLFWRTVRIVGNVFKNCAAFNAKPFAGSGVPLKSRDIVFSDNVVEGSAVAAVNPLWVDGVKIINNVFRNVQTVMSTGFCNDLTFADNTVQDVKQTAIYVGEGNYPGHEKKGYSSLHEYAHNHFTNVALRAIHVSAEVRGVLINANMGSNLVTNGGASALQVDNGATDVAIVANVTRDGGASNKPDYGIRVASTVSRATITGNRVYGLTGDLINQSV